MVKFLIGKGADVNSEDSEALAEAVAYHEWDTAKILLWSGAHGNAQKGRALYIVSGLYSPQNAEMEILRLLVENGGDVYAFGGEVLRNAASYRGWDTVKFLLENGANASAKDSDVLKFAISRLEPGGLEFLRESDDRLTCQWDVVKALIENGGDVNIQSGSSGTAALHRAAAESNLEMVRWLLRHGAQVNAQGGMFGNPLQAALYHGDPKVVKCLLESGADVHAQGKWGTALDGAVRQTDAWTVLLASGARTSEELERSRKAPPNR